MSSLCLLSSNEKKQLILLSEHQLRNLAKIQSAFTVLALLPCVQLNGKTLQVLKNSLDLTNSFWSRPIHFGCDHFILVVTKSLWSSPNQFGQTKTILDRPKLFWSHRRTRHKWIWIQKLKWIYVSKYQITENSSNPTVHNKIHLTNAIHTELCPIKNGDFDQIYLNTGSKTQSVDLIFHNNFW